MALFSSSAKTQIVHGRLFTSFYSWEREVFGADPEKYVQTYNGAILHIREIGHKDLAFHTYIRFGNTLAGDDLNLKHKLYNAYFEWKNLNNRVDISLGRQYIWAGVGNGTMDGGKAEVNLSKWGKIGAYVGTIAPLRESWKIDSWSSSHMIGAYYKSRYYDTDMQISWVRKNREPSEFTIPSGTSLQTIKASSLTAQLAGLDLSRKFAENLTLYLRTEGTFPGTIREFDLDRFELTADYSPDSRLTLTGQYFYRNPRQNLNSIFSYFSQSNNQEFWLNAYYRLTGSYSLYGGWAYVSYDDDESQRLNLGFSSSLFSVGAYKYLGYSGDMDNIFFSAQYPFKKNLWIKGSIAVGRYRLYDDNADYNNLVTSSAGVTFQFRNSMTFDIEGQGIRNSLSKSDFRLFGRFNYWFFTNTLGK